ncbi:DUF3757 domain-containing protein [Pseudomonas sp. S1_E04]
MVKKMLCSCLLAGGGVAQAVAGQGCPYPSSIHYVGGYFETSGERALWRSQRVEYRDFVDVFLGAVFTPGKDQARENGYLEKCMYRTGSAQVIALRYGSPREVDSMSLTGTLYWHLASDALGQDVYICQDSQPDNCSFTIKGLKP